MTNFIKSVFYQFKNISTFISSRIWLSYGLGALLFIGLLIYIGTDFLPVLMSVSVGYFLLSLIASMLLYPIASLRWQLITNNYCGYQVGSFIEFLLVRMITGAGGLFGPRELVELGGRAAWLINKKNFNSVDSAKVIFIDRLSDLYISSVALMAALTYWLHIVGHVAASICVVTSVCIAIFFPTFAAKYYANKIKLNSQRTTKWGNFYSGIFGLLSGNFRLIFIVMLLSSIKFIFLVLRVYFLIIAVDIAMDLNLTLVSVPLGQLAFIIAPTPGGLGVYETGWFALMSLLSIESHAIAAFLVLLRVLIIFSIIWAMPLMFLYNWYTLINKK